MARFMAAFLFGLFCIDGARADPVSDFYRGKNVLLIVGNPAGGIYDIYARTIAKHMRQYVPGNPNIVVQNMPSAGSIVAVNHIMNVAPQDGTVIGASSATIVIQQLAGIEQAKFDPLKTFWLGSPTSEVGVTVVWHTVPVNSLEDMKTREVIMGSNGPAGNSSFYAKVINDTFKTKIKTVYGYQGLAEAFLAMERGETEGYSSAFWNQLQNNYSGLIRDKKIKLIFQYGKAPHPGLAGVRSGSDLPPPTADDRLVFEASLLPLTVGYPYFASPSVPAERKEALRAAFIQTLNTPAFVEEARKLNLEVAPVSGAEIQQAIATAYSMPGPLIERFRNLYNEN